MASIIMANVTIMTSVSYGKFQLRQTYYGNCIKSGSVMTNVTEPSGEVKTHSRGGERLKHTAEAGRG